MATTEPQRIECFIHREITDGIAVPLAEFYAAISDALESVADPASVTIEFEDGGGEEPSFLVLRAYRDETPEEAADRISREEMWRTLNDNQQEALERRTLAQLKAKYEGAA